MPRFFFHIWNGAMVHDETGVELPDIYAAQNMAIVSSGELLRDTGVKFWNQTEWKMEVADEHGQILFILRFSGEEYPT